MGGTTCLADEAPSPHTPFACTGKARCSLTSFAYQTGAKKVKCLFLFLRFFLLERGLSRCILPPLMETTKDIVIGMVGSGGDGVAAAGDILATASASIGLHCMMVKSFGAQIRGGESSCKIRIADGEVLSQGGMLEILLAFNWDDFARFPGELDAKENVSVVCDAKNSENIPIKTGEVFKIPFDQLIKEAGNPKAKNIIALGVLSEIFNLPKDGLKKSIEKKFSKKEASVLEANLKAVDIGMNYAVQNKLKSKLQFKYSTGHANYIATGNDALAYGAVTAGCKFLASYPITPASEIMEWIAREIPKFDGTMVQAEDEIASVCMVVGASFGGVKAMTSTSGPGISLKIEAIGLGTIAELPFVVVNVQRGGPATGIPTKSEQADLWQAVGGMHGDAPHAVIAPTDVEDCFYTAIHAFNIAEEYQMPVIILSDQFIGHRKETVKGFDTKKIKIIDRKTAVNPVPGEYKRFEITDNGVSPITYPGIKGGEYTCVGIEHNEGGNPSSRHDVHEKMSEKRARKLAHLAKSFNVHDRFGPEKADIGIIAWGSMKGIAEEVTKRAEKIKVSALVPKLILPLQTELINDFISSCKKILIVEMSYTGQFRRYLASQCNLPKDVLHLKSSGGRHFTADEILDTIKRGAL